MDEDEPLPRTLPYRSAKRGSLNYVDEDEDASNTCMTRSGRVIKVNSKFK